MDSFFVYISQWGPYVSLGIVGVYFSWRIGRYGLHDMKDWKRVCLFAGSLLVVTFVVLVLKEFTGQARPYTAGVISDPLILKDGYDSFPSQHAAFMWSQVVSMLFVNRRISFVIALLAGLVAWSRVVVGAHYVHDVLAGILIGTLISLVVWVYFKKNI